MKFKTALFVSLLGVTLLSSAVLAKEDSRVFLQNATQVGIGDIYQAQLALRIASVPEVQGFAKILLEDQKRINKQLKALAEKKLVGLPDEITPKQEAVSYRLSKLSNRDRSFERKYLKQVIKDRETALDYFQKQGKKGTDAEVKAFATKAVPIYKSHLETAKRLSLHLENPPSGQDPSKSISSTSRR